MAAFSFSLRDKWGMGAAAGVALCLGVGGWAYNSMESGRANNLRPHIAAGIAATAPLDLPAGDVRPAGDARPAGIVTSSAVVAVGDKLVVHVAGSVKNPGVYTLKPGDRINDAVKAAGGFKVNAQQDALNLADTVRDADQIFVPTQVSPVAAIKLHGQNAGSEPAYSVPEGRTTAPYHALIVRGTPVRVALASPSAVSSASTVTADDSSSASADAPTADEPAPPFVSAPAPQGRILGRPAPAVESESGAEGSDPQESAPAAVPAPYPAAAGKSRRGAGNTRRPSGSVAKSSRAAGGTAGSSKFKNPGDGVVHLNGANAAELEKLPGVGPAMSARILEYRHQIGGFKSVEQILDVKGIGDKKFAKMRPFLAL